MVDIQGDLLPFRITAADLIKLCSELEEALRAHDSSTQTKFEVSVRRNERYSEQCDNTDDVKKFLDNNALPKVAYSFSLKISHGERSIEFSGHSSYSDYIIKGAEDASEAESYRTILSNFRKRYKASRILTYSSFAPLFMAPIFCFLILGTYRIFSHSFVTLIPTDSVFRSVSVVVICCYLAFVIYSLWAYSLAEVNPEICFRHALLYINSTPKNWIGGVVLQFVIGLLSGIAASWLLTH